LSCEKGDDTSWVVGNVGNRSDETRGESDNEETVNDEEEEVSSHEGKFDAGLKRNTFESSKD